MSKWTITVAFDVPMYAHVDVEATTEEEAIAKALAEATDLEMQFDWDASGPYYANVLPELNTKHDDAGALDYVSQS